MTESRQFPVLPEAPVLPGWFPRLDGPFRRWLSAVERNPSNSIPVAAYLGDLGRNQHPTLAHYWGVPPESGGPYEVGSLWFVAALLAFSLAYALLRRWHPLPAGQRRPGPRQWWLLPS